MHLMITNNSSITKTVLFNLYIFLDWKMMIHIGITIRENSIYPEISGIPFVTGKILVKGLKNLNQYDNKNAQNIETASDSTVNSGIITCILVDLFFKLYMQETV